MEQLFRCGSCTINPFSHFGYIEVYFHYPSFPPDDLDQDSEISLQALSDETSGRKQEHVFGCLLRYRARSAEAFSLLLMVLNGFVYLFPVEAVMRIEQVVLAGYHGFGKFRGNMAVAHPCLVGAECLVVSVLDGPYGHQWSPPDRYPFEGRHP